MCMAIQFLSRYFLLSFCKTFKLSFGKLGPSDRHEPAHEVDFLDSILAGAAKASILKPVIVTLCRRQTSMTMYLQRRLG